VFDQIKTQLDSIAELSDEQVTELQAEILSQFEMVEGEDPTPETVDAMTSLADSIDMVRGELSRREAQAAELAAKAAEAVARVKGQADDTGEEMAMTEDMPMKDEDSMEEVPVIESEDEVEVEAEEEDEKEEEMSIQASADESTETVVETSAEAEASVEASDESVEVTENVTELSAESEEIATEASTDQENGSELSTTSEEVTELSTEETAEAVAEVEEVAELSSEETIETSTALVEEQKEQAVTAAAEQPFEAPADRQPVVQVTEVPVAITAGADIPGYSAGSPIASLNEVSSLMEKRLHSLRRVNGGDGEQHIVASFSTQYPEDRFLGTDAEANSAKIESVVGQQALVASGGHAAPVEVKYDIFGIGSTTVRPVRDSLPRFQADRGGIRFVTPPSFAAGSYADAVGVWTAANDSAETPSPSSKTSLTVTAAAEQTAVTDAVTLQLQFGNLMTRAYPELIARHNELALVQHAREAEQYLIGKIDAASTNVTSGTLIGFGRDFLVTVRKAAVAYRSRHRIAQSTQLKAIIPDWVYDAMAADLAIAMPGDNTLAVGRSEIEGYLAQLNVTLVASPDMTVYGAQGAAALLEFPDTFDWYLFAEGTFLFLDGGTLDLGIIRDSSLVGTNDYKMFIETFEGIANVGIESLRIRQTVNVNGVAAALRDTTGGATAAAIEL
jgi:chemotaxis protein histidine kinase CheA